MRINKLLFTIVITNYSWGQFYQGVHEVDPYQSKLSKVDIYLQTSPDNINEKMKSFKSTNYNLKVIWVFYVDSMKFFFSEFGREKRVE